MKKKKKNRRKRKTVFSFFTHKRQETRAPIINKGILSKTNSNNDSVNRISKWKQPFSDVCQNMCSQKFRNIHMKSIKASVLESPQNEVTSLKACNSIQKRLQHRRFFPENISRILRTAFLQDNSGGCLEQTKKHFLALDQKCARKNRKIYQTIENNLNRNGEAISLSFIREKDASKNFTGKHLYQSLSFVKVACLKTSVY